MKCRKSLLVIMVIAIGAFGIVMLAGCDEMEKKPTADTGVKKVTAKVETGADGMTVEQRNVRRRLEEDNKQGAIKHLYVIAPISGDCLFYDIVDGKVTSSNKRLTSSVYLAGADLGQYNGHKVMPRIGDDGTYSAGGGIKYLYYWNANGIYRQVYVESMFVIVSEEPIRFPKIVVNMSALEVEDR